MVPFEKCITMQKADLYNILLLLLKVLKKLATCTKQLSEEKYVAVYHRFVYKLIRNLALGGNKVTTSEVIKKKENEFIFFAKICQFESNKR